MWHVGYSLVSIISAISGVNQIRNLPQITGVASAGFADASLWETTENQGDAAIKRLINAGLKNTSVTVVFVGAKTSGRKFINYEIDQSIARGNGIVAIEINHLKNEDGKTDPVGATPAKITRNGYKVYKYIGPARLAERIEEAAKAAGK